ncbi:hypothetical protein BgiBS90_003483, partial [Biomphalaria glabrata]
ALNVLLLPMTLDVEAVSVSLKGEGSLVTDTYTRTPQLVGVEWNLLGVTVSKQ